jgi:hypothetical protein
MGGAVGTLIGGAAGFAIGGPAGAAIGAGLGSGFDQSQAAGKASSAQQQAASQATAAQQQIADQQVALQREIFERQTALQAPFREAGLLGQNRLLTLLGLAPSQARSGGGGGGFGGGAIGAISGAVNAATQQLQGSGLQVDRNSPDFGKYATAEFGADKFQADPGYAFRMSEGMKALERSAAARGGLLSGATLRGTQRFGQDLASQEYQNAFNRYQAERAGTLNPYQALAGTAQSGANVLGQQAGQMGSNVQAALGAYGAGQASNILGAGNAQASGYIGQANALAGGLGQGLNFYTQQQMLNRLPMISGGGYGGGF